MKYFTKCLSSKEIVDGELVMMEVPAKGQPHSVHKFCPEFSSYNTHDMNADHGDNLSAGEESCTMLFEKMIFS